MSLEITLLLAALLIAAACIAARIVKNLLRERKRNVELAAKWKADAPLREAAKEEKQRQQLRYFINGQIKEFRALPSLLQQIQQRVQNAKNEFDQRAFSPFWEERS